MSTLRVGIPDSWKLAIITPPELKEVKMTEQIGQTIAGMSRPIKSSEAIMALVERLMKEKAFEDPHERVTTQNVSIDEGRPVDAVEIARILSAPYSSLTDGEKKILSRYVEKMIFTNPR